MQTDKLTQRMKKYESVTRNHLMNRCPVIIRVDGKSFHTFTRKMEKPFDDVIVKSMQEAMKYLCENIQGCVLGYTQSDEITLVLTDYQKLETCAWFDYSIQKCASVAASMATMAFNKTYGDIICGMMFDTPADFIYPPSINEYFTKMGQAVFDARVFNIPKEEVCNNIYWRQSDAIRNSISAVGQANFSHRELHGKSREDIIKMLAVEKGIHWNELPTHLQRGSCCVKTFFKSSGRLGWDIDENIPIFKGEDRKYVDDLIYIGE